MILSANIEIAHLVMNESVHDKNTQNMFLDVLGHILLPVLAFFLVNWCLNIIYQNPSIVNVHIYSYLSWFVNYLKMNSRLLEPIFTKVV